MVSTGMMQQRQCMRSHPLQCSGEVHAAGQAGLELASNVVALRCLEVVFCVLFDLCVLQMLQGLQPTQRIAGSKRVLDEQSTEGGPSLTCSHARMLACKALRHNMNRMLQLCRAG